MKVKKHLIKKAKSKDKTIVFPEAGYSDRIIKAVEIILKKEIAKVILIADESQMAIRFKKLKGVTVLNPKTSHLTKELAEKLFKLRKEKGLTQEKAKKLVLDPFYFSVMLLKEGYADGMVAGAEVPTAKTIKPALEIIKTKNSFASSAMMFFGKHKHIKLPIILSDPALNPNPSSEMLARIAFQTTETFKSFFPQIEPKVAFLSYSTNQSAKGELVEKVKKATKIFKKEYKEIKADGEMQLDTALLEKVGKKKFASSLVAGKANVLIVPDLNAGNIAYKSIQYFGNLMAIGPIVQGLNKPVNDLSRGCTINDIVLLTALTVLQA